VKFIISHNKMIFFSWISYFIKVVSLHYFSINPPYFCRHFYRFSTDDLYRSIKKTVFPPLLPISKVTSNPNGKFRFAVSKDSCVSSFLRNGFVKSILPSTSCFTILRMREHAKERRFISRQPSLPVSRHKRSRRSRCTCIDALVAASMRS